ncbi:zf-HC2 domain-containing protein [Streptomyces sp. HUAS MG47]|uniref:anti-sigma factor family protein n=1 Tax=Streptomyces solicamelliae TaxID=3231716 RepID=UPI003877F74D
MSSSSPLGPTPVEHHLGDRLAALVDGELGHDARERVLAHLATCAKCKAEADAQRSLKNVFAQAAPPPPSEGLLARLQGLPGGPGDPGGDGGGGSPFDPVDVFGLRRMPPGTGFATAAAVDPHSPKLSAPLEQGGPPGFRIHDVGRPGQDRAGRGRRFAFAAASAVSFAAIALGGALPLEAAVEASARGEGAGAVTPARSGGGGGGAQSIGDTPTDRGGRSAERPAPLLVTSARLNADPLNADRLNAARLNDARLNAASGVRFQSSVTPLLVMSPPLIRPTGSAIQSAFAPVLPTATPEPTLLTAPTHSSDPLPSRR